MQVSQTERTPEVPKSGVVGHNASVSRSRPSKLMARVQIPAGASADRRLLVVFRLLKQERRTMSQAHTPGAENAPLRSTAIPRSVRLKTYI